MARFAKELTISAGTPYNLGSIASYTPNAADKIIITPLTHGGHEGNVKMWLVWGSSTWKVNVSDAAYAGKVLVVIKTP